MDAHTHKDNSENPAQDEQKSCACTQKMEYMQCSEAAQYLTKMELNMAEKEKLADWESQIKSALAAGEFKKHKYDTTFALLSEIAEQRGAPIRCADFGCGPAFLSNYKDPRIAIDFYDLYPSLPFIKKIDLDTLHEENMPAYDVVINLGVLEYIQDLNRYLQTLRNRNTGYVVLYFTVINNRLLLPLFKRGIKKRVYIENFMTESELYRLFSNNGYHLKLKKAPFPKRKLSPTECNFYVFELAK